MAWSVVAFKLFVSFQAVTLVINLANSVTFFTCCISYMLCLQVGQSRLLGWKASKNRAQHMKTHIVSFVICNNFDVFTIYAQQNVLSVELSKSLGNSTVVFWNVFISKYDFSHCIPLFVFWVSRDKYCVILLFCVNSQCDKQLGIRPTALLRRRCFLSNWNINFQTKICNAPTITSKEFCDEETL